MATDDIFGGAQGVLGGGHVSMLKDDAPAGLDWLADEYAAGERRRKALRGFDVLVEGGDLSLRPNARAAAVDAFGEEFVSDWEGSDESVREMLAGMRFNAEMRQPGEDEVDMLMRYRDATMDKSLMDDSAMWRHYSRARKSELETMRAERQAGADEFARLVSRVVRSDEPMTEAERVAIVKGGVGLDDVAAAKSAFRRLSSGSYQDQTRAYDEVEGRETARELALCAWEDFQTERYRDGKVAAALTDAASPLTRGVEMVTEPMVGSHQIKKVLTYADGSRMPYFPHPVTRGEMAVNEAADRHAREVEPAGMEDATRADRAAYDELGRRRLEFVGKANERRGLAATRAAEAARMDSVGGVAEETFSAVGEFLGMAASFATKGASYLSFADMLYGARAGALARGAGHSEPMDDETYGELVRTQGREKAAQMRADWQREASRAAVDWTSTAYAAAEYAAMRIGLGAARRLGGRLLPRQTGGLVSWLAPLNSRLGGAWATGAAGAAFDLGVAMPLSRGAMKWAYDQLPWSDPKLAEGAEELAGAWDEMQKWRYWFKTGVMAMTGGAMHMSGARKRAQKILGERKGALVAGLTGEQFDSTLFLPEGERVERLSALYRVNMEKEPEEAIKRGIAAGRADTDHQKAAQMRQDGAIEAAMRMHGYSIEPGENGKGRLYYGGSVNEKGEYTRGEKFLELDERELDTFVEQVLGDSIRDVGAVLREEVGKKRLVDVFKARLRGDVSVEWMRAETFGQIKRAGERAKERIEQRVAEELERNPEADEAEVRRAVQGEVAEDIGGRPLGELAKRADEAQQRAAIYEAKTGKALPENAPFTMAAVKTLAGARKRRVLRIANEATVEHVAEEFGEQLMVDWMEQEGMDFVTAFLMLDALRQNMLRSGDAGMRELAGRFLTLEGRLPEVYRRVRETGGTDSVAELAEVRRDVIEALSTLMLNDFRTMAREGGVELPGWARPLFDVMERDSLEFHQEMALGTALAKAREEGWMPEAVEKLLGMSEGEIKEALAEEPGMDEYVSAFREAQRREAEFDSHDGRMHSLEESERLYQAAAAGQAEAEAVREAEERAERERSDEQIQEMEAEPENAGKSREEVVKERAERYGDAKQEEIEGNPAAESDAAFCGGKCLAVEDETGLVCRGGLVETGRLTILPNFKEGAHNETGVVVPLTGDYRPDHDPIRVWERGDGSLVVISGRHRLDAARRAGATRIMAYVYREDARHDELWAKRFDIESNIRDNQATALEVALYVRGEYTDGRALTDEEVARAGIDRGGKLGAVGYAIGREAVEDVIQAFKRGELDEREAFAIAHGCPGDEKVQRAGLKMARSGGGKLMIQERMVAERSKQEMQASLGLGGKDLFGESLDDDEFMDFVTKYVVRRRNELAKDIQYIRINAGKRNSKKMADKYGVDVKDPDGIKKKMAELEALRDRWMHPYTDGELMDEVRAAWRAEHPDGKASGSEMVFKTFSENAAALVHMQMVHEDYSMPLQSHEAFLGGRVVDLRKVRAVDKEGNPVHKDAYLLTPKGNLDWYEFNDREAAWLRERGLPVLPVRMKVGRESARTHGGYGFIHMLKHADEIDRTAHMTPLEYFYRLSRNLLALGEDGAGRKNRRVGALGGSRERSGKLVIELRPTEKAYTVIAMYPHNLPKIFREGDELQIGDTVFRFLPSGEADQFEPANQRIETAADRGSAQGATLLESLPRHQQVVNINDVKFVDDQGEIVHEEPYNEHIDFSVAGAKAAGIEDARKRGMTYVDPADGKEKFVIPLRGKDGKPLARLNTNFTRGQMMGVPVGGHKTVTMGALMSYPELYRNYPELAKMKVRLYNPLPGDTHGELGFSCPARKEEAQFIALNVGAIRAVSMGDKAREEWYVLDALLHEGQHAIQHYEGFAGGANGAMDKAACLRYLEQAERDLVSRGVKDDWSRDNLKYLRLMHDLIEKSAEGSADFNMLRDNVYSYSHGELEARWTGEGNGDAGGSPWLGWEQGTPTWQTVSVLSPGMPDMLGGRVYGGLGRFGRLLEDRLGTAGDFEFDRRIMQMLENIQRRMRELKLQQGKEADGLKLAAEGSALMDSLALLLPDTYRFALEPYKVYFASYAKLRDTGDTYGAGKAVPMRGWDDRMAGAYERILREVLRNVARKGEAEFWVDALVEFPDLVRSLGDMQQAYAREWHEAELRHPRGLHESRNERMARLALMDRETMTAMEQQYPELMIDLRKAIGGMRADRMMGKFLERVRLQLDAFRKDRTLGRIRRAVELLTPKGSRDGKPVKGHIGAEAYRRVLDYVRLMELTRGQDELFMEGYAPEDSESGAEAYQGKRKWSEVAPEELVEVRTYDSDGKEYTISCTKQEYEVYSCFDTMSSAQAEAAGRALGEYIATGRQAWENAEEAARQRIAARCTPLLEGFSETENERRARRKAEERSWISPVKKVLNLFNPTMNDAQFFDALSGVKEIEPWAREFTERIAAAHVYIDGKEKERHGFLMHALMQASGESDRRRVRAWFDGVNESRDTGVRLVPGEPDFLGRETDALRVQFLGLLRRKTHMKNFRPNTFAEALRFLSAEARADVPEQIIREAVEKYGSIGNAADSRLKKEAALASVLTAEEFKKYRKMVDSVKARAEAARKKWQEENKARLADRPGDGGEPLVLTRLEAAYRVLMCQQEDYRDMLALQGYDADTVARLEKYAGEDVMKLAYALRDKLGERTGEIRELYERVYGMPFPAVENYFRAYFDVNQAERRETTLDGQGTGKAAGGGRVRILYTRRHHNQKLDPTMDVLTAFNAAMREQDVLIGYGDLPSDITRLVNYRTDEGVRMVDALRATIGVDATDTMMLHANNMKQLTGGVEEVGRTFLRLLRRVSSPSAVMILNFRVASLVKQYTALLNTVSGSDMVGLRDWSKSAGRVGCGLGKISLAEMARRPELSTRFKGWWTGAEKDMMFGYGDNVSAGQATEGAWRAGMSLMEWVDVRQNVRSACILYDAVYRKLQRQDRGASHEELDMLAMNEVRRALALKSQPQDFRQRALLGAKAGVFKVGNMFLGGESWNLLGNCARLAARGKPGDWKRLAEVWLAHGAALSALTMAYNIVTDDEEQWKKRNLVANFLWGTLMGPVNGIPFLAQLGGGVVNAAGMFLPKGWRGWVQTSSIVPMGDLNRVMSDFKKAWGKHGTWQDKSIAVNNALRFLLTLSAAAFSNPTTKTGAAIKGASYAAGAAGNVADFLLRVERAAEERL